MSIVYCHEGNHNVDTDYKDMKTESQCMKCYLDKVPSQDDRVPSEADIVGVGSKFELGCI